MAWWIILERMSNSERLCAIDLLLKINNINARDKWGDTALIWTSEMGYLNVINRLLECKNIDVNVHDEWGWTALIWASAEGHLKIVNRLLECKDININIQNVNGNTALMMASNSGHSDIIDRLKKFQKNQILEGFDKTKQFFPCDLTNLIAEFSI